MIIKTTFIVKNKQSCVNEDCVHRIKQKINIIEFFDSNLQWCAGLVFLFPPAG